MTRLQFIGAMLAAPFAAVFGAKVGKAASPEPILVEHRRVGLLRLLYAERRRLHDLSGFSRKHEPSPREVGEMGVAAAMAVDDATTIFLLGATVRCLAISEPETRLAYERFQVDGDLTTFTNAMMVRFAAILENAGCDVSGIPVWIPRHTA